MDIVRAAWWKGEVGFISLCALLHLRGATIQDAIDFITPDLTNAGDDSEDILVSFDLESNGLMANWNKGRILAEKMISGEVVCTYDGPWQSLIDRNFL